MTKIKNATLGLQPVAPNQQTLNTPKEFQIEQLYQKYKSTSGCTDLRCLIKLLLDPVWRDQQTANALYELDCYAGEVGATHSKIQEHKLGAQELSVLPDDGGCLVRGQPASTKDPYDRSKVYVKSCEDCKRKHSWNLQRGYIQAALLGLYDDDIDDDIEPEIRLIDLLLGGFVASHTCHNSACSDIFHTVKELQNRNLAHIKCVNRGVCVCEAVKRCRLHLKWASVYMWKEVKKRCDDAQVSLLLKRWRCTKDCRAGPVDGDRGLFAALMHWWAPRPKGGRGCKRGGTYRETVSTVTTGKRSYNTFNMHDSWKEADAGPVTSEANL